MMGEQHDDQNQQFIHAPTPHELWRMLIINQQNIIQLQKVQERHQQDVAKRLQTIEDILSQAKGGWRVLVTVGTIATIFVGAIAWILDRVFFKS